MRILVAEDDLASCRVMAGMLAKFGQADLAFDGQAALHKFEEAHVEDNPYNLICLDVQMPYISGLEVLKRIRAFEEREKKDQVRCAKIIMTTGLSDVENVLGSFRAGCEDYLIKPIDRLKLFKSVKSLGFIEET